jgi:hypothetical protein
MEHADVDRLIGVLRHQASAVPAAPGWVARYAFAEDHRVAYLPVVAWRCPASFGDGVHERVSGDGLVITDQGTDSVIEAANDERLVGMEGMMFEGYEYQGPQGWPPGFRQKV